MNEDNNCHVKSFQVPPGLNTLMSEMSREVLRHQPAQIIPFLVKYLANRLWIRNHKFEEKNIEMLTEKELFGNQKMPPLYRNKAEKLVQSTECEMLAPVQMNAENSGYKMPATPFPDEYSDTDFASLEDCTRAMAFSLKEKSSTSNVAVKMPMKSTASQDMRVLSKSYLKALETGRLQHLADRPLSTFHTKLSIRGSSQGLGIYETCIVCADIVEIEQGQAPMGILDKIRIVSPMPQYDNTYICEACLANYRGEGVLPRYEEDRDPVTCALCSKNIPYSEHLVTLSLDTDSRRESEKTGKILICNSCKLKTGQDIFPYSCDHCKDVFYIQEIKVGSWQKKDTGRSELEKMQNACICPGCVVKLGLIKEPQRRRVSIRFCGLEFFKQPSEVGMVKTEDNVTVWTRDQCILESEANKSVDANLHWDYARKGSYDMGGGAEHTSDEEELSSISTESITDVVNEMKDTITSAAEFNIPLSIKSSLTKLALYESRMRSDEMILLLRSYVCSLLADSVNKGVALSFTNAPLLTICNSCRQAITIAVENQTSMTCGTPLAGKIFQCVPNTKVITFICKKCLNDNLADKSNVKLQCTICCEYKSLAENLNPSRGISNFNNSDGMIFVCGHCSHSNQIGIFRCEICNGVRYALLPIVEDTISENNRMLWLCGNCAVSIGVKRGVSSSTEDRESIMERETDYSDASEYDVQIYSRPNLPIEGSHTLTSVGEMFQHQHQPISSQTKGKKKLLKDAKYSENQSYKETPDFGIHQVLTTVKEPDPILTESVAGTQNHQQEEEMLISNIIQSQQEKMPSEEVVVQENVIPSTYVINKTNVSKDKRTELLTPTKKVRERSLSNVQPFILNCESNKLLSTSDALNKKRVSMPALSVGYNQRASIIKLEPLPVKSSTTSTSLISLSTLNSASNLNSSLTIRPAPISTMNGKKTRKHSSDNKKMILLPSDSQTIKNTEEQDDFTRMLVGVQNPKTMDDVRRYSMWYDSWTTSIHNIKLDNESENSDESVNKF